MPVHGILPLVDMFQIFFGVPGLERFDLNNTTIQCSAVRNLATAYVEHHPRLSPAMSNDNDDVIPGSGGGVMMGVGPRAIPKFDLFCAAVTVR